MGQQNNGWIQNNGWMIEWLNSDVDISWTKIAIVMVLVSIESYDKWHSENR